MKEEMDMNKLRLAAVVLLAALGLVAAAGASASSRAMSSPTVTTRSIKGLGVVLVNSKGRTLYVFMKDKQRHVTCTGACASYWPPLKKGASKSTAGGSAQSKLLGADRNPAGGKVVTYNKWPLYTYVADSAAGQAKGENVSLSGGKWYVISPSGRLIKHRQ
jgi:predicted lipoprotein with Yx(FWY)xxD motif